MTTKAKIKASYIANLQAAYTFYAEGSKGLELAHHAADKALDGTMRITGDCWKAALKENGLPASTTLKALAALPEA